MSPAPRPALRLPRLLMACALALALVLAPSACTPGRTDAVVTTISAQRAEEESATASADCTNALETGSGTVALLSLSSTASRDSTLVVSRDADDRIQWAVLIDRPTACIRALSDYPGKPQDGAESILDNTMGNNPVSYAVLSPDGARLSLILLPEAVGDVAQQRTPAVPARASSASSPWVIQRHRAPPSPAGSGSRGRAGHPCSCHRRACPWATRVPAASR